MVLYCVVHTGVFLHLSDLAIMSLVWTRSHSTHKKDLMQVADANASTLILWIVVEKHDCMQSKDTQALPDLIGLYIYKVVPKKCATKFVL